MPDGLSKKSRRERPSECLICYRSAMGYHCGVITCKACKTFFRRMCLLTVEIKCKSGDDCFNVTTKNQVNIRCQACRYKKCIEMRMNPTSLEFSKEEKEVLSSKKVIKKQELISIESKDIIARTTVSKLTYLEMKLEMFRSSAYNPVYYEQGSLEIMVKDESKMSLADKYGLIVFRYLDRLSRYDVTKKRKGVPAQINFRCQPCRYKKCLKLGMSSLAFQLTNEEKRLGNISGKQSFLQIESNFCQAKCIVNRLIHLEEKLEIFRLSAYNPSYFELGNLENLTKCGSKLSTGGKFGPMPGWPLSTPQIESKGVTMKSKIRDIPDEQPNFPNDKKIWMLFNTFTTIEYAKTFEFFHRLQNRDKIILVGHVTLICMFLHNSYYAVSKKTEGCLQPDGTESPQKDEGHYSMMSISIAPLIRCNIQYEEYILLKAICLCNPTIHGLSKNAQLILSKERQKYGEALLDYCFKHTNNGPCRFVELLGIIPILEHQQQVQKNFYVFHLAPILAKYNKIATFLNDIMFL